MAKSEEFSGMVVDAAEEAFRQAGLDEEGLRLLLTRREEFRRILIGNIRSSIEGVTNEGLRTILNRSIELEKRKRENLGAAVVEDVKKLMRDAASTGSSVRERQQRERLDGLISYWASVLRIRTGDLVLGPGLDPFVPKK